MTRFAVTHFLDGTTEDRPGLAAAVLMTALAVLALQDAIARLAGEHISFWQFQAMRAGCNVVLLLAFARAFMGGLPRRPARPWAVAARVAAMIIATLLFFGGLPRVSIVEMAAGLYTYPIFVTILSALFLGERIGIRRIAAVLVGAVGAMLILQPGGEEFVWVKLMPVGAGLAYGCNIIITRRWCRGENAVTMALAIAGSFVVIGTTGCVVLAFLTVPEGMRAELPYLTHGWRGMATWVLAATVLCSVLNASANVLLTKAYQSAESSWLAPFDYSYLIFAAIMGLVLFGTLPGPWQVVGMALIAGAGMFTAWRERKLRELQGVASGTTTSSTAIPSPPPERRV